MIGDWRGGGDCFSIKNRGIDGGERGAFFRLADGACSGRALASLRLFPSLSFNSHRAHCSRDSPYSIACPPAPFPVQQRSPPLDSPPVVSLRSPSTIPLRYFQPFRYPTSSSLPFLIPLSQLYLSYRLLPTLLLLLSHCLHRPFPISLSPPPPSRLHRIPISRSRYPPWLVSPWTRPLPCRWQILFLPMSPAPMLR